MPCAVETLAAACRNVPSIFQLRMFLKTTTLLSHQMLYRKFRESKHSNTKTSACRDSIHCQAAWRMSWSGSAASLLLAATCNHVCAVWVLTVLQDSLNFLYQGKVASKFSLIIMIGQLVPACTGEHLGVDGSRGSATSHTPTTTPTLWVHACLKTNKQEKSKGVSHHLPKHKKGSTFTNSWTCTAP